MKDIRISHSDGEDRTWRTDRLNGVLGYVCAVEKLILEMIIGLNDHEGTLTVEWHQTPGQIERKIVERAWASDIGDCSNQVLHTVGGQYV